jgi:hypothetical protein
MTQNKLIVHRTKISNLIISYCKTNEMDADAGLEYVAYCADTIINRLNKFPNRLSEKYLSMQGWIRFSRGPTVYNRSSRTCWKPPAYQKPSIRISLEIFNEFLKTPCNELFSYLVDFGAQQNMCGGRLIEYTRAIIIHPMQDDLLRALPRRPRQTFQFGLFSKIIYFIKRIF